MGKARIIEALGEGQYTIEVVEARERAESAKQQAEARITSLQSEIAELQGDLAVAQQAVDAAAADQNTAISQYQADMAAEGESSVDLEAAARAFLEAVSARDQIAVQINVAQARIKSDQALIARVNALPPLRQMQAWCADYTDDLSGEVATAEVPGEIGKVIIKPSFAGSAWSASSDGAIQPALASTPAGAFYNLAMMPGWQKWRPTYRTATITSISGDACDISLDAESSSQQGLNVNSRSSYSGVPILYMDCNGAAFESGDKVLVAFAGNVNEPVVCGFESAPKVCNAFDLATIADANFAKPSVSRAEPDYYTEDWMAPELAGLPIASGSYSLSKTINKDNINVTFNVSHIDSQSVSESPYESGSQAEVTHSYSCDHSCNISGTVDYFEGFLSISYSATISGSVSVTVEGSTYNPDYPRTVSDSINGPLSSAFSYYDSYPFLSVVDVFSVGKYSIDISKISDYIYNLDGESDPDFFRARAEWLRYYPRFALHVRSQYSTGLYGLTNPLNNLMPDILPFKNDGKKGVTLVFSACDSIGDHRHLSLVYVHPFYSYVRYSAGIGIRYYDPSDQFQYANRLTDKRWHVLVTLVEQGGTFERSETPTDVINYHFANKLRGASFGDDYYDLPVSVDISPST